MDIKELENRVEEHIGHDYDCALFDETNNQCDCGTFKTVRQIMSSFNSYMAEVIGEFEPDTITRPDGHISTNWDGIARNFLRKEILASAGLDQPATRHGEGGERE